MSKGQSKTSAVKTTQSTNESLFVKAFYIFALYSLFVISGVFEEKVYKQTYTSPAEKKIKFVHPLFAIFCTSMFSYIISSIVLFFLKRNRRITKAPFQTSDKVLLGAYYIVSRFSAEYSLQYLDYISKIIGKSCKSASIILIYFFYNLPVVGNVFKAIINQSGKDHVHTHGSSDFVKVIITTIAIILFNYEVDGSKNDESTYQQIILGYAILSLSLLCDGLISLKEKIINHEAHLNEDYSEYRRCLSFEYMSTFSFWSIAFGLVGLAYEALFSNIISHLGIYLTCNELMKDLIINCIFASLGQIVIYIFLEKYGPLNLSIITGIRKILTIAISIIYFGKHLSVLKVISLIFGASIIIWEIMDKKSTSGKISSTPLEVSEKSEKKK